MPRTVKTGKLTELDVVRAKKPVGDGGGLWLMVKDGRKSWSYRFNGREMVIGPLHTVSLSEARKRAQRARLKVLDGIDPIEDRRDEIAARKAAQESALVDTFKSCAERYIESHKAGWKNAKHVYQWRATMRDYAYPVLGEMPVARISTPHVLKVLEPLWSTKTETATRVRGRIEKVLDWARVRGYRTGENPARWKGHLAETLPKLADVRTIQHHPALPYSQAGAFMQDLRRQSGIAAEALQFTILCAVRTNETTGADWSEIDLDGRVWIIPPGRMKGKKATAREHRVPLSDQAIAILQRMSKLGTIGPVFPGAKKGRSLSNMAMLEVLRRMEKDFTVHGFRSTFSDWAREATSFPRDLIEMALAHAIKDKTEAAYFRADLLEKRRALMQTWADFCDRVTVADGSNVVQMSLALA